MEQSDKLIQRIAEYQAKCQSIREAAEKADRDFTDAECLELDENLVVLSKAQEDLERLNSIKATELKMAKEQAPTQKMAPARARIEPVVTSHQRNRFGYDTFGDYLHSVIISSGKGNPVDNRLIQNAPTTVGTEGNGPDGGFAVPPDFRSELQKLILGEGSLLSMTDQQVSSSNTFTVPVDETTPWQSTGGILAYWTGEGGAITQSKPALKEVTLKLHKLACLVPLSEELMQDSASMESYVKGKAAEKINFELNRVIVQGTGAGQPLGILNSSCLVTAPDDGAQAADSITFGNVVTMWSKCYAPCRNRAVWLINQDIEPQLLSLAATTYQMAYMPPGGLSAAPYATLFGRPVIATQACETVGDLGDIILADLQSYLTVSRSMRQDMSIHLYFDYDVAAFRFILRVAGQPWWSTSMAARDGSGTYSPFVGLAARAGH